MKKKKILFLINTMSGGGAEKVLLNIANSIDYDKFDVTVKTIFNKGVYIEKLNNNIKYRTIVKNTESKLGILLCRLVNKIIVKFNAKLLHALFVSKKYDCEIAFLEGASNKIISGANKKVNTISWVHTDFGNNSESELYYNGSKGEGKSYINYNKIVFVSERSESSFNKKYPGMENKTCVIYNPIDIDNIRELSKEEKIEKNGFTICSVGRLTDKKSYDRLVRIHRKLLDEGIKNNVWIVGEGEHRTILEKMIKEYNVVDTFKLIGFNKNPYKYLANSDLFVSSSSAEGFSLVTFEAIILNIPIVVTDCAGIKLYENYGLVSNNDEQDLYRCIKELIINKELYNKYKNNNDDTFEKMISKDIIIKTIESLILEVSDEKSINNC